VAVVCKDVREVSASNLSLSSNEEAVNASAEVDEVISYGFVRIQET
jgi:hypothetical protein